MELSDLVGIVPDMINLFLPGYVFIVVYDWLRAAEKREGWSAAVGGLMLTQAIRLPVAFAVRLTRLSQESSGMIATMLCLVLGAVLPFAAIKIQRSLHANLWLNRISHKSFNDDILRDVIDREKASLIRVYFGSSQLYAIGRYCYNEEKGRDSYIGLTDYEMYDMNNKKVLDMHGMPTMLVFCLQDVERMEITYKEGSDVWERFKMDKGTDGDITR